ncbi:MAG: SpoIIE family protein phosphatase [Bacteroidales bacterium]|nr:SpoIIE family protein phosphatase [Bacteroidales bacterium]
MKRIIMGLSLLVVVSTTCLAQKIPLDNYTGQNGLPQNTVYDIDQDFDGYIWFATQVGAARFDGYEFEYFNSSNGLPDDIVNCLMVDRKGNVWLGTEGGIAVFDGTGFSTYTVMDGLVDNRIDGILEDQKGNVWITTVYGLSVITEDDILSYAQENALIDNSIIDVFADSRGRVHVATLPGLTLFQDPHSFEKLYEEQIIRDILETTSGEIWYATQGNGIIVIQDGIERRLWENEGLSDGIVFSLLEDHKGRIWCGTYLQGLFLYEKGRFGKVSNTYGTDPIAAEIYEDENHRIWIRTFEDGVWLYDEGDFKHITTLNNLAHNNVRDIFEDKFDNIWLGTLNGVSKYGRVIFEIYDMDLGLPDNNIASVYVDSRQRIWFGTYGSPLYKDHGETFILDNRSGFPVEAMPLCFAEDSNQIIYIGTDVGLHYYDGRSIRPVEIEGGKGESSINSLLYTSEGDLWCATDSGIIVLKEDEVSIIGGNEGLVNPQVNSIKQFGERICCATEGGISVFALSGKHIATYTTDDGLASNVCIDVTYDLSGNIWVATNRGLSRIGAGLSSGITSYNIQNGLTSNTTYFVELSDSVSLWIGTERGINVLNISTGEIEFYGYEDGFYPLETNARAISKGQDGELWIGTVGGLVHYNPKYNIVDTTPPDLILFPPMVDGELLNEKHEEMGKDPDGSQKEPVLPYNKNSLIFNFTGIHTTIPLQNRFSYMLEGFDENWSLPGPERSVSYKKLPNGSYVFRVKAYNLDGISAKQEASFAFTIMPPFWKTIWFIILEIFAGLMLVYGIIKYRERQLIREKKILETKVKKRTREIEDQKVEIEAQRDEIADQKRFVEEQRDQIVVQNKEITDSIHYANRIQQAVLPGKHILEHALPEYFIMFKPRDIVSGDFYWVEERDGLIIVCAADCTGHGVPGAFMSMLGLTFLNEIVNKDGIVHAGEILNRLRSYIITTLSNKDESSQTRDGMDLALVVIDRDKHRLEYAGAYNPLLLIRDGNMIEYKADKMPIGKHVGEEGPFTNHMVELCDRDMIYLYTDGFHDQFGGEKDSKYKARPFKRLLHRISAEPVDEQVEILDQEFYTWKGKSDQVDDILILGIRYTTNQT